MNVKDPTIKSVNLLTNSETIFFVLRKPSLEDDDDDDDDKLEEADTTISITKSGVVMLLSKL